MTAAKMKSRILTGPQVRALLDTGECVVFDVMEEQPPSREAARAISGSDFDLEELYPGSGKWRVLGPVWAVRQLFSGEPLWKCPHAPGERRWVRETFAFVWMGEQGKQILGALYETENDDGQGWPGPWTTASAMPRKFSRLTVETASVAAVEHDGKWCWRELLRKVEGD